jgi:hypothetical protein
MRQIQNASRVLEQLYSSHALVLINGLDINGLEVPIVASSLNELEDLRVCLKSATVADHHAVVEAAEPVLARRDHRCAWSLRHDRGKAPRQLLEEHNVEAHADEDVVLGTASGLVLTDIREAIGSSAPLLQGMSKHGVRPLLYLGRRARFHVGVFEVHRHHSRTEQRTQAEVVALLQLES